MISHSASAFDGVVIVGARLPANV
jgi:hypothetical protein